MSIKNNDKKICVVGLGYVGLTLGVTLAYKGLDVFGAEVNSEILDSLKNKKAHFNEDGLNDIVKKVIDDQSFTFGNDINEKNDFDVYLITVGTPLNTKGNPRLDMIKNAASQVASAMNENSLVILRSTVQIGVTREVVKPILDKSGKTYDLAMCPERTLEGNAIEELSKLPQIIGSDSRETSERCASLFNIITNQTNIISSWEAAEIIKLSDNTYRDVSFAFGNEIARVCSAFNVDCYEVIENGKSNYPRTNISLPGLVGGPCLEKDPHIYSYSASLKGVDMPITQSARLINENQPKEIAKRILNSIYLKNKGSLKILLCGLAFKGKPETDDIRGSMGIKFFNELNKDNDIFLFDYVVPSKKLEQFGKVLKSFDEKTIQKYNLIVILNNHEKFKNFGLLNLFNFLEEDGIIFDFWNTFKIEPEKVRTNCNYFTLANINKLS